MATTKDGTAITHVQYLPSREKWSSHQGYSSVESCDVLAVDQELADGIKEEEWSHEKPYHLLKERNKEKSRQGRRESSTKRVWVSLACECVLSQGLLSLLLRPHPRALSSWEEVQRRRRPQSGLSSQSPLPLPRLLHLLCCFSLLKMYITFSLSGV